MAQRYKRSRERGARDLRSRERLLLGVAAASLAISIGCCGTPPPARPFAGRIDTSHDAQNAPYAHRFAIIGDLQTTSLLEFWREENDYERALLVQRLADIRPAFLIMLGDLVSNGSSKTAWADFDDLCAPIRDANIPVLPVPGNHEYWLIGGSLDNYFERFPHLAGRSFYDVTYGSLGLIFLNSNKGELTAAAWEDQSRWYRATLRRFDAEPTIRGVLVLLHHPPYTNSTVTSDEMHIQLDIVPAFNEAKKTLAMITGHVHSYERFNRNTKTFLVSGGGGGPRAELHVGRGRRHKDDLYDGPSIRSFHYLSVAPSLSDLAVDVVALREDGSDTFSTIDTFKIPWATLDERRP